MRLALLTRYLRTGLLSILFCISLLAQSLAYSAGGTFTVNDGDSGETFNFFAPTNSTGGIFTSQRIVGDTLADCPTGKNISPTGTGYTLQYYIGGTFCFNTTITIYWTDSIGIQGNTGSTGETGLTGATGSSAYEIAQSLGFTGTVTEWLNALKGETGAVGATGTTQIIFATGEIFSGATFSLDSASDNATLDASGSYLPIVSKIDGTYYIDKDRMSELAVYTSFALFFFIMFGLYLYNRAVGKKSFY